MEKRNHHYFESIAEISSAVMLQSNWSGYKAPHSWIKMRSRLTGANFLIPWQRSRLHPKTASKYCINFCCNTNFCSTKDKCAEVLHFLHRIYHKTHKPLFKLREKKSTEYTVLYCQCCTGFDNKEKRENIKMNLKPNDANKSIWS